MRYRRLGRTALQVSEICLGTMNFGPMTSREESFALLGDALEAGINFVDTADQYGGRLGVGATERLLGEWLAEDPARRDRIVLATKVHEPMSGDINDRGLSARHIQRACEASLRRLGVDHIDLYQMHHIDRAAPPEEIWQAMDRLIAQGKITYVGSSNFPGWAIARFNERASQANRLGLVSEQGLYNLLERRAELEVLPACQAYGVGMIVWSPLAGGLLAGPSEDASGRRAAAQEGAAARAHGQRLEAFGHLCGELGVAPGLVAVAWLLRQPGIASVIVGPRRREQLSSLLGAVSLPLDESVLRRLDEVFPPCGAAPEAYAW